MSKENILNQTSALGRSDQYRVLTTGDAVVVLERQGYRVRSVQAARVTQKEREGFQPHIVRLQHETLNKDVSAGLFPEIILRNSYDGTAALKLSLGIYRLVCANGLVAGTSFGEYRVIHRGDALAQLNRALEQTVAASGALLREVKMLQETELTLADQEILAIDTALDLIKNRDAVLDVNTGDVLKMRRLADSGQDAFTVLNRVQENILRHGFKYRVLNEFGRPIWKKQRAISSISRGHAFNQLIWDNTVNLTKKGA